MNVLRSFLLGAGLLLTVSATSKQPDPPGQVAPGATPVNAAYLFVHMTDADYGRMYYSASLDGLHWYRLNDGKRITDDYRGHPDIAQGPDGTYYIAGNQSDASPVINLWSSRDLITWTRFSTYTPDLKATPGYSQALQRIGAPKLFFDKASQQFVMTWHTPHLEGTPEDGERYWASQRTLYVTSKDLKTFSAPPKRLLKEEMGTIDLFLRHEEGKYWAVLKDETYPTLQWTTGKTIRIASSDNLLGPYEHLSAPISPNFREAPMLIPSPDGKAWYLYYEQYPGVSYGLSVSSKLAGPWYQISGYTFRDDWDKYSLPPKVRHGTMLTITRQQYDALVDKFGIQTQNRE
ncbi:Glycosyl hydrolases family 43 [Pseudoxanthomonas sp. GM95]|uniref:glycoside hydrolase family 43 protein n=1 Tax=Pseudoxanthomonas sp. GM95 TaxID=1881043 RepID=UPI0008B01ED7|nr:glycoside hydrolase family 43 protein [Pseudoxanthomonas sp. GM95]SEL75187.1 Glycosyl hydrolases family 43 [Pseudoxanthomonas sp. GM95]